MCEESEDEEEESEEEVAVSSDEESSEEITCNLKDGVLLEKHLIVKGDLRIADAPIQWVKLKCVRPTTRFFRSSRRLEAIRTSTGESDNEL